MSGWFLRNVYAACYLMTTESTPFRQPTVYATTANLAELRLNPHHQCLPEVEVG
jgi:hypothetical protein